MRKNYHTIRNTEIEELKKSKTISNSVKTNDPKLTPHAFSARRIAEVLNVEISQGLSTGEANRRISIEGLNAIERKQSRRWWHLLFDQFSSIVVWLAGICRHCFFFYRKSNWKRQRFWWF